MKDPREIVRDELLAFEWGDFGLDFVADAETDWADVLARLIDDAVTRAATEPEAQADTAQATGDRPRIVIDDDGAHVTGYTDPDRVVGVLLAFVESITGVGTVQYAALVDAVHRKARQLPDEDRVPGVPLCECPWLGIGTAPHVRTGFCRITPTDLAEAGPASAPTIQERA